MYNIGIGGFMENKKYIDAKPTAWMINLRKVTRIERFFFQIITENTPATPSPANTINLSIAPSNTPSIPLSPETIRYYHTFLFKKKKKKISNKQRAN
jgi:hypothetical protein